jgi:hypothetical protein
VKETPKVPTTVNSIIDSEKLRRTLRELKSTEERDAYVQGLVEGLDMGIRIFRASLAKVLSTLPSKTEAEVTAALKEHEHLMLGDRVPERSELNLSENLKELFSKLRNPHKGK